MKHLLLTCAALAALATAGFAAEPPAVDAVRAAKIATDFLSQQGAGAPYIVSVVLDQGALINGRPTWVVHWSKPIVGDDGPEVGVRVKGDGSVVRLVEGKSSPSHRRPAALNIR